VVDAAVAYDAPTHRLIGYLVATSLAEADLRAHLARTLPGYLQPSAFVRVPVLPRTGSGKVDRRSLPRPEAAEEIRRPRREPATGTERAVAEVWALRLRHDEFDADTNFFVAGGDSLMLLAVIEALRERFEMDIPVRVLIDRPTVAGLAARIDELRWAMGSRQISVDRTGARETGEL
jgi:acyl-CoA synthetase (AMP-forming)/AMP-acid ligase II